MHTHAPIQNAAKAVLAELASRIGPDSTEASLVADATTLLAEHGYRHTWYHACPVLVLLGSRSSLSVSGRVYRPAEEPVGQFNLVTVDLSPCDGELWGDCARSFCVEDGVVVARPRDTELAAAMFMQRRLHQSLIEMARPTTTFDEVCSMATSILAAAGYENLDFLGNFGHTIGTTLDARAWVEPGSHMTLEAAGLFTFEPHIRQRGGRWGFKHEDVYYIDANGILVAL